MLRQNDCLKAAIRVCEDNRIPYDYHIENNKYKFRVYVGSRSRMIIIAKTPSDMRASQNVKSEVKRAIYYLLDNKN